MLAGRDGAASTACGVDSLSLLRRAAGAVLMLRGRAFGAGL